jgi:hypothetical protein
MSPGRENKIRPVTYNGLYYPVMWVGLLHA